MQSQCECEEKFRKCKLAKIKIYQLPNFGYESWELAAVTNTHTCTRLECVLLIFSNSSHLMTSLSHLSIKKNIHASRELSLNIESLMSIDKCEIRVFSEWFFLKHLFSFSYKSQSKQRSEKKSALKISLSLSRVYLVHLSHVEKKTSAWKIALQWEYLAWMYLPTVVVDFEDETVKYYIN